MQLAADALQLAAELRSAADDDETIEKSRAMALSAKSLAAEAQKKLDEANTIAKQNKRKLQKWVKGSSAQEANKNLEKFLTNEGFQLDFEKCINNEEIEDFVLNDRIDAVKKFKVNATPTIIINNEKFEKSLNYKNLKKALEPVSYTHLTLPTILLV